MYSAIYSQSILSFLKPLVLRFNGKCLGIEGVQFYPISLSLSLGKEVSMAERGLFSLLCAYIHHVKANSRTEKGWSTSYPSHKPATPWDGMWEFEGPLGSQLFNLGVLIDLYWIKFRSVVVVGCCCCCGGGGGVCSKSVCVRTSCRVKNPGSGWEGTHWISCVYLFPSSKSS